MSQADPRRPVVNASRWLISPVAGIFPPSRRASADVQQALLSGTAFFAPRATSRQNRLRPHYVMVSGMRSMPFGRDFRWIGTKCCATLSSEPARKSGRSVDSLLQIQVRCAGWLSVMATRSSSFQSTPTQHATRGGLEKAFLYVLFQLPRCRPWNCLKLPSSAQMTEARPRLGVHSVVFS
jgi:hypothetical protein